MRDPINPEIFKKRKYPVLVGLFAFLGTVFALWDIHSWKFACVGDEQAIWEFARNIADSHLRTNPLGFEGVFHINPVFSSYLQAVFLTVFGNHYAVWKLSGALLMFPCIIVFARFVRCLFGKGVAVYSAFFMAFSAFLCNSFKIDGFIPICLLFFLLSLYQAARVTQKPSKTKAVILGLLLGLSWFNQIGPLFSVFLIPFVVLHLRRRPLRAFQDLLTVIGAAFFVIGMGLMTNKPESWFLSVPRTALSRLEYSSAQQYWLNVAKHFLVFYNDFSYLHNRFVAGPYLDVVSRCLATLGFFICIVRIRKKEGLLLSLWICTAGAIGLLSPYDYVSTTRGAFIIPFGIIFAGIGIHALSRRLAPFWRRGLLVILLGAVAVMNVYESQSGFFKRQGYSNVALILKELKGRPAGAGPVVFFFKEPYSAYIPRHVGYLVEGYYFPEELFGSTQDPQDICRMTRGTVMGLTKDASWIHQSLDQACGGLPPGASLKLINGCFP